MDVTWSWRSSATRSDRLAVGRVAGAKGLAGAIRVEPLTDRPDRLIVGSVVHLDGEEIPRRIIEVEAGGRMTVLRIEGIENREAAESVRGRYLEADAGTLPKGTYYWHQIVGLRVTDEGGAELGTVAEVFRAGENEVYRVTDADGRELLIPAVRSFVRSIDLEAGRMVVDYRAEEVP
jgi:16S rRNA processing protein RimM